MSSFSPDISILRESATAVKAPQCRAYCFVRTLSRRCEISSAVCADPPASSQSLVGAKTRRSFSRLERFERSISSADARRKPTNSRTDSCIPKKGFSSREKISCAARRKRSHNSEFNIPISILVKNYSNVQGKSGHAPRPLPQTQDRVGEERPHVSSLERSDKN